MRLKSILVAQGWDEYANATLALEWSVVKRAGDRLNVHKDFKQQTVWKWALLLRLV